MIIGFFFLLKKYPLPLHYLPLDGMLGTEPDYFPTIQPLLWNSNLNKRKLKKTHSAYLG